MADSRSPVTFEDFTQSMMRVIDRALDANRASENQLMRNSCVLGCATEQRSLVESTSNKKR